MVRRIAYLFTALGLILSSCTQATLQVATTPAPSGVLTPYHTLTPTPIIPTATYQMVIQVTPAPTPTPFMHTVTNDDTMLGIAYQYGITLEDLQAANPGVDPHFMGVGMQLVIPISGEIPEIIPTPTPAPLDWKQPQCFRTREGGAWCILPVRNALETSMENISAGIGLFTPEGTNISSQVVYASLNLLRPGKTLPLMSYFAPPLPEEFEAHAEILSALPVADDDTRYLDLEDKVEKVEISTDGTQAIVSGEVIVPDGTPLPSQLWALIVAYDSDGNIIGARKWESSGEAQFELPVYSLAGRIDHIEVLTETRP
jgi:LysM repeat protein